MLNIKLSKIVESILLLNISHIFFSKIRWFKFSIIHSEFLLYNIF